MQLGKWDVEVNGQDYSVSVERAENGKDIVRINGRVAAKPIGPEEETRSISVAGWPYLLKRINPNAYDLEVEEVSADAARARTVETANAVLAHGNAPVAIKKDSFFEHLPKLGYLAVVAGVVLMMYMIQGPSYDKVASARVKRVFSEMHEMKGSQFAITFWFKNKKVLDSTDMNIASDAFTRWSKEKDMNRQIGDFEVIDSTEVKGATPPTAIVHVKVEGNNYTLLVKKDLPLEWSE